MNELTLSKDINVITAEINSYKNMAGQAIFEIGIRLNHVKNKDLSHGEFGKWLESIDLNWDTANRFMKIANELNSNSDTYRNLGWQAMYLISTIPETERKKTHTLKSGEQKTVDEMTVRELREVKRALKEAKQQVEQAKKSEEIALRRMEEAENKPPKVIERVVEDETKIIELKKQLSEIEGQKKEIERKMQQDQYYANEYKNLKSDIERLADEKKDIVKQIDNASTIGKFIARVERSFEEDLAPIKYTNALYYAKDNDAVKEAVNKIVNRVEKWCEEIRNEIGERNYIDAEVIDYE